MLLISRTTVGNFRIACRPAGFIDNLCISGAICSHGRFRAKSVVLLTVVLLAGNLGLKSSSLCVNKIVNIMLLLSVGRFLYVYMCISGSGKS